MKMTTQKQYDCYNTDKKTTQKAYQKNGKQRIKTTTQITRDCAVYTETNEDRNRKKKQRTQKNKKRRTINYSAN